MFKKIVFIILVGFVVTACSDQVEKSYYKDLLYCNACKEGFSLSDKSTKSYKDDSKSTAELLHEFEQMLLNS